jgi:glycerol-3-phosphate dehydrogenase (NAD(P)+)
VAEHLRPWVPVVSLTKGLEQGTRLRMTQVVGEILPGHPAGVLTGPNLAKEILAGHAAASVIAMSDLTVAVRAAADLRRRTASGCTPTPTWSDPSSAAR